MICPYIFVLCLLVFNGMMRRLKIAHDWLTSQIPLKDFNLPHLLICKLVSFLSPCVCGPCEKFIRPVVTVTVMVLESREWTVCLTQ